VTLCLNVQVMEALFMLMHQITCRLGSSNQAAVTGVFPATATTVPVKGALLACHVTRGQASVNVGQA